jgi:hypothetical protein
LLADAMIRVCGPALEPYSVTIEVATPARRVKTACVENIRPLIATYRDCQFRSHREARWAVFFDHLNIPWMYKPSELLLDNAPYVPDFLLYPNTDLCHWFEVKPNFVSRKGIGRAIDLADGTGIPTVLYFGGLNLPAPGLSATVDESSFGNLASGPGWGWDDQEGWTWFEQDPAAPFEWAVGLKPTAFSIYPQGPKRPTSSHLWWTDCPYCDRLVLKVHGQVGWCPYTDTRSDSNRVTVRPHFAHETARLQKAYSAARSATFDQKGQPR